MNWLDDWVNNPRNLYFDRNGTPIDMDEWGVKNSSWEYKVVGRWASDGRIAPDDPSSEGQVSVSTVWLGINHGWGPGLPVIFETMIFGGPYDDSCMRYCTEIEAYEGHQRTVDDVVAGRAPWFLRDELDLATGHKEGQ